MIKKFALILEDITKFIWAKIRARFAGFGFFANCLRPKGYVSLRKTKPALRSSNFSLKASFAISSLAFLVLEAGSLTAAVRIQINPGPVYYYDEAYYNGWYGPGFYYGVYYGDYPSYYAWQRRYYYGGPYYWRPHHHDHYKRQYYRKHH